MTIRPCGAPTAFWKSPNAAGSNPSWVKSVFSDCLSRSRSTTLSPKTDGRTETRKSISRDCWRSLMPVLRKTPLGDVEVRHDLEARNERGLDPLGRRHHL